ncbi:MAG TPA: hypothetical protein VMT58_01000, partial [Candidatus Binataceae bacterium]|nr:hypothetical protein [Candidatus Binataceae bacterium]
KLEESAGSDESIRPELRKFMEGRRILVAGSTAPGEESIVLSAYRELCGRYPDLALVIAPRHIERTGEIERMMRAESIQYCKASALDGDVGDTGILVLDTMGELRGLYYRAAIAFIGGSLVPGRGGQSPAEAAVAAVPVLIGPHHENQTEIVMTLVKVGAARIVRAAGEIVRECAKFLDDESTRVTASLAAREASRQMAGGARRVVAEIEKLLGAR